MFCESISLKSWSLSGMILMISAPIGNWPISKPQPLKANFSISFQYPEGQVATFTRMVQYFKRSLQLYHEKKKKCFQYNKKICELLYIYISHILCYKQLLQ